jgi:SpoVK/Ycf46/Vps4 family AAA+-type ATPase
MEGLDLQPTSYTNDQILNEFIYTQTYTERINKFFSRLEVYKKHGIEIPKRGCILYGPPGSGKSSLISKIIRDHTEAGVNDTVIINWPTAVLEAAQVKEFLQTFKYTDECKKLILIVEDIGGVEQDRGRAASDSSLLSLLDNQEKTFTIPVYIIATTNFPENFLENLTNRPGRFDDKFEVGYPPPKFRSALLSFYGKDMVTSTDLEEITKSKYDQLTPAHIKEIVIRADIYEQTITSTMSEMLKEIEMFHNMFQKKRSSMGITSRSYDD